jgi:hypothetical protein
MIFVVMALSLVVLLLWSVVVTPRVIRRTGPRVWIWWACWLVVGGLAAPALFATGFEALGWWQ